MIATGMTEKNGSSSFKRNPYTFMSRGWDRHGIDGTNKRNSDTFMNRG